MALGTASNALGWVFWGLAAVAVGLRWVGARSRGKNFRLDDYLMAFSLILNLCGVIFNSVAIHYGLGQHIRDLDPEIVPKVGLWAVVADSFCLFADVVPKLAVALMVNRILIPPSYMKIFHIALTTLLITFTVAVFLVSLLQCHPVRHQWDPEYVPGSCLKPTIFEKIGISEGALGAFVDLYFSLYPPIVISQLHMAWKKKIIAGIIMSLGLFTLFTTLYKTAAQLPKLRQAQADITYILCEVVLWGLLESSVTMIAGSIPTWGWLLRTRSFESIMAWTTMHSSRVSSLFKNGSHRDEEEAKLSSSPSSGPSRRGTTAGLKPRDSDPPPLYDSIGALERSALR